MMNVRIHGLIEDITLHTSLYQFISNFHLSLYKYHVYNVSHILRNYLKTQVVLRVAKQKQTSAFISL